MRTSAVRAPNDDTKVIVHAPATLGTIQSPKVTVLEPRRPLVLQRPQPLYQRPRRPPLRPRPCVMPLLTQQAVTQTPDSQVRLGYNLLSTRDGPKTVLPYP